MRHRQTPSSTEQIMPFSVTADLILAFARANRTGQRLAAVLFVEAPHRQPYYLA